ncbi:DnaJ domain-containing protein [Nitrosospira multiformis]|uniref:DnaJ domain-containing protein n=2 Tax=Nitrosospira multiformis TaxID=1231 RepID=A0A1H8MLF2_9PROT|nr:DnaJ domain-containing protein [Nitrosospira multiformis]
MLVVVGADLLHPISDPLERELKSSDLEWIWLVLMWAYIIGGYLGSLILLNKTILPFWLPSYLYARSIIFTKISADEAKRLSFLFDGSLNGSWYPLGALRKIDPEFRREALFRFANKIAAEQGWQRPFAMPEDILRNQHRAKDEAHTSQKETRHTTNKPGSFSADPQIGICLQILGLHQMPKSFEDIKAAYRRKIAGFHPDKFSNERAEVLQYAEEESKRLNFAYSYLESRFAGKMT